MSEIKYPKLLWMDSRSEDAEGYTFALNATTVNDESRGFLATELGNSLAFETSSTGINYAPLGFISLSGDKGVLLSVSEDETRSEIGLVHNSTYTTIINSTELGFSLSEQIQGTYTIVNGCEAVIVFRAPSLWTINIDSLDQYLLAGETQTTANSDGEGWDVSLMKLFFDYTRPLFGSITIDEVSGSLPLGTYQITTNYLDSSLNETGWLDFSLPIPIVDESFAAEFQEIDGGFNSDIPATNKSIVVQFDGIDTSFSYLRVAVVANNDGVRTAYKIIDYPITSTSHTISISTLAGDDITTIPLSELTVQKTVFDAAKSVVQTENRLVIGAPTEKQIDHAAFQRMANEIKVNWFNKEFRADDVTDGNKSVNSYIDHRGYMSNEVYSLGVEVYFTDGYVSPVYHIPGREQNVGFRGDTLPLYTEPNSWHSRPIPQGNWDSSLLAVGTHVPLEDVEHLGFNDVATDIGYGNGFVPRWKVCNTAIKLDIPSREYYAMGDLAYWESSLPYPDSLDCDGERVFPTGNIRHHKMPDVTLVPHYLHDPASGEEVFNYYPLGLNFSNIVIPTQYQSQVAGYKIVREKRNSSNSSVYDRGMFTTCLRSDETLFQPWPYNSTRVSPPVNYPIIDGNFTCFHSPTVKFNRNYLPATHIKIDQKLNAALFDSGDTVSYYATGSTEYRSYARFKVEEENPANISSVLARKIADRAYLDSDTLLNGFFDYDFDNTEQEEAYVLSLDSYLEPPNDTFLPPYEYPYLSGTGSTDDVWFYYGGLERYIVDQYGLIGSGVYIPCSSDIRTGEETKEYGGDTFISRLYFRRHARIKDYLPVNQDESADYIEGHMVSVFVESTINCGFRNEGTEDTEIYFPKSYWGNLAEYLEKERYLGPTPSINDDLIPNYYAYNSDFSAEADSSLSFTLPSSYDYCQSCAGEFLNRVAWTQNKTSENSFNPWRVFLANDYVDLTQDKGQITNLFIDDYKLYAQTLGSIIYIPTQYQEIKIDNSNTYIGTGTFMGLGGKELKSLKEGYGGSDSQWATCTTEVGTFVVSYDKIFLVSQGSAVEVSRQGMTNFFLANKMKFYSEFFAGTGIEYPFKDNPANSKGLGFLSTRSPKSKAWILSKKDYSLLFTLSGIKGENKTYSVGEVYWDNDNYTFQVATSGGSILVAEFEDISFWDETYFKNESYTISFDLDYRGWISFHSYFPRFMFNTLNSMFTFAEDGMYEHQKGQFRHYYGTRKPFIIEQPILQNRMQANVSNTVQFECYGAEYDDTYKTWKQLNDETFNKMMVYNDYQSSGILDLVKYDYTNPFDVVDYTPGDALIFKADKVWNVDQFYNYATAQPLFSKRWEDIKDDYYIDKIPINIDTTLNQLSLERFRDGYLSCRFIYDTDVNKKLLFKYLRTYDIPSVR